MKNKGTSLKCCYFWCCPDPCQRRAEKTRRRLPDRACEQKGVDSCSVDEKGSISSLVTGMRAVLLLCGTNATGGDEESHAEGADERDMHRCMEVAQPSLCVTVSHDSAERADWHERNTVCNGCRGFCRCPLRRRR